MGEMVYASALAVDGSGGVYVADWYSARGNRSKVHALDSSGELRWVFHVVDGDGSFLQMCTDDEGMLYASTWGGRLYCLTYDGSLEWIRHLDHSERPKCVPYYDARERRLLAAANGQLHVVKPDGSIAISHNVPDLYPTSLPKSDGNGNLYFMGLSGGIVAVEPHGSVKWHYTRQHDDEWWDSDDKTFAVDENGQVFCSTRPDGLMSLDQDGEVAWRYTVRPEIGSPVLTREGAVIAGGDNALCSFSKDGILMWEVIRQGYFKPLAVGPEGTVYCMFRRELSEEEQAVGTYGLPDLAETFLVGLDDDGREVWRHEILDNVLAGPVFASDGTLYLLCDNGWTHGDRVVLFAFDP